MSKTLSETVTPALAKLSRKTGPILRPVDSATVNNLTPNSKNTTPKKEQEPLITSKPL